MVIFFLHNATYNEIHAITLLDNRYHIIYIYYILII